MISLQKSKSLPHAESLGKIFKCNLCKIKFSTEDNLINHNNFNHNQLNSIDIVSVHSVENLSKNKEIFLENHNNVDIYSTENIVLSPLSTYSKNISIKTEASCTETDATKPELHKSLNCNFCDQDFLTENEQKMHNCHKNRIQGKSIKIELVFSDETNYRIPNAQLIHQQDFSTEMNNSDSALKNVQIKYERPECLESSAVKLDKSYLCGYCELSFCSEHQRDVHRLHSHTQEKFIKKEIITSDETAESDYLNVSNIVKYEENKSFEQCNSPYNNERNTSSLQGVSPCLENVHVNREMPTHTESILVNTDTSSHHCGQNLATERELKMHHELNHKHEEIAKVIPSLPVQNRKTRAPAGNSFLDTNDPALENAIECGLCKMYFESRYILKKHFLEHHPEQRTYECTFCSKKFLTESELVFHLRTHTKAKQSCTLCGKSYGHVSYLHRHLLTHSNCKPYSCLLCGQKFLDKSKLKKHYQKTH
ncbi:hypothetical protein TNCT_123761 [Trichonephila clavata]|uniref:C2H2-type domain-containing protein n=1 Tax=Trichonephila clavata TaxID=2740835 RepID=A0A8X6HFL8_TRICU|nr:hypothetical protein TNCT_123761 [Trichonephila clavata]